MFKKLHFGGFTGIVTLTTGECEGIRIVFIYLTVDLCKLRCLGGRGGRMWRTGKLSMNFML